MTGEKIKAIRGQLGLTQIQLADKLGVGRNSLSFYETGKFPIDRKTELAILAVVAGLDVAPD